MGNIVWTRDNDNFNYKPTHQEVDNLFRYLFDLITPTLTDFASNYRLSSDSRLRISLLIETIMFRREIKADHSDTLS